MQHTAHARRFFYLLLLMVLALGALFLRPYLTVMLFAAILAFLSHPLYGWLEKVCGGRQWLAVPLAMIGVLLAFVIPITLAGLLIAHVVTDFSHSGGASSFSQLSLGGVIDHINVILAKVPGIHKHLTVDGVNARLQELAAAVQANLWQGLKGLGGTLFVAVPVLFITLYVMGAVFTRYHRINQYLHRLSPLDDEIDSLYARRITSMVTSIVRGTLVIATLQGIITGLFLWIGGVPYAPLFGLLAILFSIIPLGAGVISIPIGILLIVTGNYWQGILQIAGNLLVVGLIDNLLRPRLVSKEASLHPALVLIGAFTGLYWFGFLGVIFGPVIMVVLVTTIEVYREYFSPEAA